MVLLQRMRFACTYHFQSDEKLTTCVNRYRAESHQDQPSTAKYPIYSPPSLEQNLSPRFFSKRGGCGLYKGLNHLFLEKASLTGPLPHYSTVVWNTTGFKDSAEKKWSLSHAFSSRKRGFFIVLTSLKQSWPHQEAP